MPKSGAVGLYFSGSLAYADDRPIALISPVSYAMRKLLHSYDGFASFHGVKFSASMICFMGIFIHHHHLLKTKLSEL
jgi:hypothetical protein